MPPDSEPAGEALAALRVAELEPNPDGTSRIRIDWSELGPSDGFEPGGSDDIALLLHTSGTTSGPKQVPLRQRNLAYSARARDAPATLRFVRSCSSPLPPELMARAEEVYGVPVVEAHDGGSHQMTSNALPRSPGFPGRLASPPGPRSRSSTPTARCCRRAARASPPSRYRR